MHFYVAFFLTLAAFGANAQTLAPLSSAADSRNTLSTVAAITPSLADLPDFELTQVSLRPETVRRFLASLPSMVMLAHDLDRQHQRDMQAVRIDESLGMLLAPHLFVPGIAERVTRELQVFGFANHSEWADIAYSIGLAAKGFQSTGTIDLDEQMQGLRREIEADPNLPVAQKAAEVKDLERKFAALAEFRPRPGNHEAVEPFLEQLRAAVTGD